MGYCLFIYMVYSNYDQLIYYCVVFNTLLEIKPMVLKLINLYTLPIRLDTINFRVLPLVRKLKLLYRVQKSQLATQYYYHMRLISNNYYSLVLYVSLFPIQVNFICLVPHGNRWKIIAEIKMAKRNQMRTALRV